MIDGCSWRSPDVLGNSDFMTDIPGPHHVVHFVLWVNTMLGEPGVVVHSCREQRGLAVA